MLIGDLLEGFAAALAAAAVYLIVGPLVCPAVGVGCTFLVIAAFIGYVAQVHGGVPLRRAERAESS